MFEYKYEFENELILKAWTAFAIILLWSDAMPDTQYPGGRQTSPHTNPGKHTGVWARAPPDWILGDV